MSFPRYPAYKDSGVEWLGEVPEHWGVSKLKWQASVYSGRGERTEAGQFSLYGANGVIGAAELPAYSSDRVLIGRVGSAGAVNVAVGDYAVSDNALVVDNAERLQTRYCYYWFLTQDFSVDVSTTAQPLLTGSQVKDYAVALPPDGEQQAIAAFLDHETAKIDALVAEQEKLIALLQEKRQAVISHAVTKGLDPDVPMKDSGVEWLGEVPAHWEISQLRRVVRDGTSVTYGIVQAGPDVKGGVPYIRTSDMSGDALPVEGYLRTSSEIDAAYSRSKVAAGDLVIAIRASVGKCLPVPPELDGANLTQGTAKISPGALTDAAFLLAYMSSSPVQTLLDAKSKGATFKEITLETLRKTPVLLPPRPEQEEIANRVRIEGGRFTALIAAAESAKILLKERRAALISAAVTGQIDVRNVAEIPASHFHGSAM
jgi:type I restriction enzyme S subunit